MIVFPVSLFSSQVDIDPRYQAVLSRATDLGYPLPSMKNQIACSNFIKALDAAGIWAKLDYLLVLANDVSEIGQINWKNPSGSRASYQNGPDFTPNGGFRSLGATACIDTNFNCSVDGVNYTQNNASRHVWVNSVDNPSSILVTDYVLDGVLAQAANNMFGFDHGAQRVNSGTGNPSGGTTADLSGPGMCAVNRNNSSQVRCFKNKVAQPVFSITSSALANSNQFLLRRQSNFNSVGSMISIYSIGANLISENNAYHDAMNNYMNSIK